MKKRLLSKRMIGLYMALAGIFFWLTGPPWTQYFSPRRYYEGNKTQVAVFADRVALIQPDDTLTILDAASGRVVGRSSERMPQEKIMGLSLPRTMHWDGERLISFTMQAVDIYSPGEDSFVSYPSRSSEYIELSGRPRRAPSPVFPDTVGAWREAGERWPEMYCRAASRVGGGGLAAVLGMRGGGSSGSNYFFQFTDGKTQWRGRMKLLSHESDDWWGFDNFICVADEERLVYSLPCGKVECLDRRTGQSQWIYAFPRSGWKEWQGASALFPRLSIGNWYRHSRGRFAWSFFWRELRRHLHYPWASSFYTDDLALYRGDLENRPLPGTGGVETEYPPYHVDPKPTPFPSGIDVILAAWITRLALLAIIFLPGAVSFRRPRPARARLERLLYILAGYVAVLLLFGRYDAMTFYLLWWSAVLTYYCIAFLLMAWTWYAPVTVRDHGMHVRMD